MVKNIFFSVLFFPFPHHQHTTMLVNNTFLVQSYLQLCAPTSPLLYNTCYTVSAVLWKLVLKKSGFYQVFCKILIDACRTELCKKSNMYNVHICKFLRHFSTQHIRFAFNLKFLQLTPFLFSPLSQLFLKLIKVPKANSKAATLHSRYYCRC